MGQKSEFFVATIDMGGTWMRAALVDNRCRCGSIVRSATKRNRDPEEIIADLASLVLQVCDRTQLNSADCEAVSLGVPTVVDKGRLLPCDNLPTMAGVAIGQELQRSVNLPVMLFNDATCFTMGEWWMGAGKGAQNFCGVTLGTGIGLGLVINGQIYRGSHGYAGEIWKSPFASGRVEDVVKGKTIGQIYQQQSGQLLAEEQIAKLAEGKEPHAISTFMEFGVSLGKVLSWIVNLLDPEIVALGGSAAKSFPFFESTLFKTLKANTVARNVRIVPSSLGDKAALIGAAKLYYIYSNCSDRHKAGKKR